MEPFLDPEQGGCSRPVPCSYLFIRALDFDPEQGPGPGRVRAGFCIGFPLYSPQKALKNYPGASRRIVYRIIDNPLIFDPEQEQTSNPVASDH